MVFFMQQNLNPNLKIRKALTQIYGIGSFGSNQLCDQLGLRTHMTVKNMSASQFEYWKHTHLTLHITPGRGSSFSLEIPTGKRFLIQSRLLSHEEIEALPEPLLGKQH